MLIAVISLTVAFAGPPVAGAIGNQFTAIAGAVGSGITGGAVGGIGGGTSGGTHTGGTTGGNHGTSGGTSGGGTTVKPGSGSTGGNTGTTGGGSSSGTVNPGTGSTGSQTTKPGQSGTNPGNGSTGSTGNTGSTGSGTGSTTVNPGSGSTGNTGTVGGGSSSGTTKPGSGSTGNTGSTGGNTGSTGSGNTSTKPSQPGTNPTDGLENKAPKDWTLIDQKVVAEDISKNGTGSKYYPAAKKAMDEGTKWKTALLNGQTLEYRIIGINHDNLANGSGKAGLTFMTTSTGIKSRMNATNTNSTGWKNSELRAKMNFGEIWNLLPADLQNTIKPVTKLTIDAHGTTSTTPTSTVDKLSLLSIVEIAPSAPSNWVDTDLNKPSCLAQEGTQFEAFRGKVLNSAKENDALAGNAYWWERTNRSYDEVSFLYVSNSGDPSGHTVASNVCTVFPIFCF